MSKTTPQSINTLALDYDAAFEITGHGIFNYAVIAACSLIYIYANVEMAAIGYIITPAACDLKLSTSQKSLINSGIFIGIFITAIFWGTVCDRIGRRRVMLPALFGSVAVSFLSSLCNVFWAMFLLRIITGVLVSASSATVLVYLGELQIEKYRDWSITVIMTVVQLVFLSLPGIAYSIIPGKWSFNMGSILIRPWRVFMWVWGLIGLAGAIILFFLPESPRFLLAAKGPFTALPVLAKIYARNHRKKEGEYPVTTLLVRSTIIHSSDSGVKAILRDCMQLLKFPMRRCFLITHYGMFMIYFLSFGFYIWMPDFINLMLKNASRKTGICGLLSNKHDIQDVHEKEHGISTCKAGSIDEKMYAVAFVMEIFFLIPFVATLFLIKKVNIRILYVCIMCICAVCQLLSMVPQIVAAILLIIMGINCVTCAGILSGLAVEAFPTSLRSLAMCTMHMAGQVGSVVGNYVIGHMEGIVCSFLIVIICFLTLLSAALIKFMWPDLKVVREIMEERQFTY